MAANFKEIGIDLGTSNTIIYSKDSGVILNEATAIAFDKYDNYEIIAVGNKARAMYGKNPKNIEVVRPLQDGVISDFDSTAEMLEKLIEKALGSKSLKGYRVGIGTPSGVTEVEKTAVSEVVNQIGAREVYVLDEPMAAAIGSGLNVDDSEASMITDVGGGTTDIAIVSLGGTVVSTSIRYAGEKMSESVIAYIRKTKGILIGTQTAEDIKAAVGCAMVGVDENGNEIIRTIEARGRELVSGLPRTFEVTNKDMEDALRESVETIIDAIKSTVEKAPPEIAADIAEKGMMLTGGASLIENFDKIISQKTGMIVVRAENPYEAVAIGACKSLVNSDKLKVYAEIKIRD
ncbi:MAG: rod shape-determining protein [Eubacteriales bacterium]|nr:rod shape-determining protein [Eubacteriales bacterium]MDY3332777.1 rod shape-determining protein [Gallibacter sp.]